MPEYPSLRASKNYNCNIQKSLQENASLVTNFSDQKLLVTIIINLDTSLQSKKKSFVTKIVTIMNKKL